MTNSPRLCNPTRRCLLAGLLGGLPLWAALPLRGGPSALAAEGNYLDRRVPKDPISDPISLPARIFLAETLGRDREDRRLRGIAVLDGTEEQVADQMADGPADPALLILRSVAFGAASRGSSLPVTVTEGYTRRARAELDRLWEVLPAHPWRSLCDGFWHLEVVRRGGRVGGFALGASHAAGVDLLAQATAEQAERDAAIAFCRAMTLLSYDAAFFAEDSAEMLQAALAAAARTPEVELLQVIVTPAKRLLGLLAEGEYAAANAEALGLF